MGTIRGYFGEKAAAAVTSLAPDPLNTAPPRADAAGGEQLPDKFHTPVQFPGPVQGEVGWFAFACARH